MKQIFAMACIAVVALCCLVKGLNGQIIGVAIVAIAGLGGYELYQQEKIK